MSDKVIRVENLGKKYVLSHQQQERYTTLRDSIAKNAKNILGSVRKQKSKSSNNKEEFWALDNVSFEIKQGDRVGIIGRNGAGKSTLLKILSRITEPTRGRISINGRVASLLEVGTGFHPELTGRENIYLNGAILGMGKTEIKRKFDEIVAFAEIEKFLDTPVKRYSSGMYVRLAFAVAAHLEPEILIVDEVLAVGDAQFQKKCLGKMEDVGKEGRTVIFVSHNMGVVQTLCTRGIFLKQGTVYADDTASNVVSIYLQTLENTESQNLLERTERRGRGLIRLAAISVSTGDEYASNTLATGRPARFTFHLTGVRPKLACVFTLYNQYGQAIINFNSTVQSSEDLTNIELKNTLICELDELGLKPGRYRMNVAIMSDGELQDHIEGATVIEVEEGVLRGRPVISNVEYGNVCMHHRWVLPI
ncbi:MAG: ABC transporter ATP-binding protein [Mastigocoleus sp.]